MFRVSPWDSQGWNKRTNVRKISKNSEFYKMLSASHRGEVYTTYHKSEAVVKKVGLGREKMVLYGVEWGRKEGDAVDCCCMICHFPLIGLCSGEVYTENIHEDYIRLVFASSIGCYRRWGCYHPNLQNRIEPADLFSFGSCCSKLYGNTFYWREVNHYKQEQRVFLWKC